MEQGGVARSVEGSAGAGHAVARGDAPEPAEPAGAGSDGRPDVAGPTADVRPVGPGGVLDGAFDLLRHRFGRLVAVTAAFYLPLWIVGAVLTLRSTTAASDTAAGSPGPAFTAIPAGDWVAPVALVQAVALAALGICVGTAVEAWRHGRDPGTAELLRVGVRRSWVAAVIVVIGGTAKLVAACLGGVGWLLVDAVFFTAAVVAGAEGLGPVAALRRAAALSRPAYGRCLVIVIGGLVITQVLRLSFSLGPIALVELVDLGGSLAPLVLAASSLVLLVTEPLAACIAARAHLDLRCRVEGMDLLERASGGRRPLVASTGPVGTAATVGRT